MNISEILAKPPYDPIREHFRNEAQKFLSCSSFPNLEKIQEICNQYTFDHPKIQSYRKNICFKIDPKNSTPKIEQLKESALKNIEAISQVSIKMPELDEEFLNYQLPPILYWHCLQKYIVEEYSKTPFGIHSIARLPMIQGDFFKKACENAPSLESQDECGHTLLHIVSLLEFTDKLDTILEFEIDLNQQNKQGNTALHLAIANLHPRSKGLAPIKLIQSGADLKIKNHEGQTPLDMISTRLHLDSAKKIIEALTKAGAPLDTLNEKGQTALISSIISQREDIFHVLKKAGANLNRKSSNELSPLHFVSSTQMYVPFFNKLIEGKANVNSKDKNGRTPLHYACKCPDNHEAILKLVHAGAKVNLQDKYGKTPLHYCGALEDGKQKSWTVLIKHGADLTIKDKNNQVPYFNHRDLVFLNRLGVKRVPCPSNKTWSKVLSTCAKFTSN